MPIFTDHFPKQYCDIGITKILKTKKTFKLKSKCTQLATHVQIRTESNDTNEMPEPTGAIFVSVELNNFLELQQ